MTRLDTALLQELPGGGPYTAEDVEEYYRAGLWQERTLFDFIREEAEAQPGRTFVSDGDPDRDITYAQLAERGIRLAAGLHGLGLERGDRVAVQLPNWSEFTVVVAAAARLGLVIVPIMPIFRQAEVSYEVVQSGAKALIGSEFFHKFAYLETYQGVKQDAPELEHVIIARARPGDLTDELDLTRLEVQGDLAELEAGLPEGPGADDPFVIIYTSGTTSKPKGCVHTFNTFHACSIGMRDAIGFGREDVFFNPSPVAHTTGFLTGIVIPLLGHGATHFMAEWDPVEGIERIDRYGCSTTVATTTFLTTVLRAFDPQRHSMATMRSWICAGSPIPGAVVQEARSRFSGCKVLSLYGRTENLTTTMCVMDDAPERSVTSDGHALPYGHVIAVDEAGRPVPAGEQGDLAYRGPHHALGYYRDPENTRALFTPDGYSVSGDLGFDTGDGFFRVSGRKKDIIIRGGINISAREIEDLLLEMPQVAEVAVVSMPDPRMGEKACAYVVVADGHGALDLTEVVAFLGTKNTARQKHPERVEVVESIPLTPGNKTDKQALRDDIAARLRQEAGKDMRTR